MLYPTTCRSHAAGAAGAAGAFAQECMGQLAINSNGTCLAPEARERHGFRRIPRKCSVFEPGKARLMVSNS